MRADQILFPSRAWSAYALPSGEAAYTTPPTTAAAAQYPGFLGPPQAVEIGAVRSSRRQRSVPVASSTAMTLPVKAVV